MGGTLVNFGTDGHYLNRSGSVNLIDQFDNPKSAGKHHKAAEHFKNV
jgi:hypothetical protein